MNKDLNYYARKFVKLSVDRARGIAPHKPTLLLSVIELIQQQKIQRNQIYLSPELIATFLKYWSTLVTTNHRADIALPFFHLTSEKFWHLVPNAGFEATIAAKVRLKTLSALRSAVKYASLDEELFQLLQTPAARIQLIEVLIQTWFPAKIGDYQQIYQVDELENIQLRLFEKGGAVYNVEDLKDEEKTIVRDAAFRRIVVSIYQQHCAFCKLKIVSQDSQNIVDGAHIKPFSEFRDERFDNGIALCKNHHWAFDHGWFGISDDYRIVVPPDRIYEEAPADMRSMRDFDGEPILLPFQPAYSPRVESLQWHRDFWKIA